MTNIQELTGDSITLLKHMISTPSLSREEQDTAALIRQFLLTHEIPSEQVGNNIIAYNKFRDAGKPNVLLNSHHDTVKANPGYTKDPFQPLVEEGKLYGLGSNDAGGCLVSLIAAFRFFYEREDLPFNLCLIASAEEEVSGKNGIEEAYKHVTECSFAIVGEPTLLNLAVAEKGLMVLDCAAQGESGHAAREEGINAIYLAIEDINWFRTFQFPKLSSFLGPVKMSVTMVEAGSQHNVVPALCKYVVDVRSTDVYSNQEILDIIKEHVKSDVVARSTRLNPSTIAIDHPIVQSGIKLGKEVYGSPTMSDQALLPIPSIKVGPGDSARSHTADEFIYLSEIEEGIAFYIALLNNII
ncbi:M20/M25/M40 family metallo-hydrolase [Sphingobacterium sp. DK4209]|uniref:M20/M25/M40 family metallo-hydrolase n=1 Tax=Sphingobacterium zhuxiongii TaxID=2662364 RepID=A0A5Q0QHI1_9SPHI|nr:MULTISPECIES: M20 family metallo-hydrolase [unclassified Sphingobacterium]MVZ65974.1 M20/M25/M40 family metallo-hydrolase [Sphingobacterium sp. DK4209]QGA27568.1 M20/M25/M40 family metallo-hydrolase [Sphingobacterium sp. dk4302]